MRDLISSIRGRMSRITATALRRFALPRGRDPIVWLIRLRVLPRRSHLARHRHDGGRIRERAIANSERELQNTVRLLTRHFDQQFDDTEIIAARRDPRDAGLAHRVTAGVSSRENCRGSTPTQMLQSRVTELSYVGEVIVFDADGRTDQFVE